jgi:hypothetical protein
LIDDEFDDIDSLFGSSPSRPASANSKVEEYTTIDLTEATDVPEELKKPEVDKRVKLSAFQCVICMDDVTGLTLTHCGKSCPFFAYPSPTYVARIAYTTPRTSLLCPVPPLLAQHGTY